MVNIENRIRKFGIKNVTQEKFDTEPKTNNQYLVAKHYLSDNDYKVWLKSLKRKNPYCPDYISKRDNISIEEANIKIQEYKKNKATSKEGFLKRHGEEKGAELFSKFQRTSASSTLESFIKKHGEEEGERLFKKRAKEGTRRRVEFFMKRGYTIEEAKRLVSEHQLNNSGVHKQFYISRGYSENDIREIFSLMNPKKDSKSFKKLKEKYGDNWELENKKIYEKLRKSMEEKGDWVPLYLVEEKKKYYSMVDYYTGINLKKIPDLGERCLEYHLDHKYSKFQGFKDGVDPKIIGSEHNLEIISRSENCSKRAKCSITLEELYTKYYGENINENKKFDSREFWAHIRY